MPIRRHVVSLLFCTYSYSIICLVITLIYLEPIQNVYLMKLQISGMTGGQKYKNNLKILCSNPINKGLQS